MSISIPWSYPMTLPRVKADTWEEDFSGLFAGADPTNVGYANVGAEPAQITTVTGARLGLVSSAPSSGDAALIYPMIHGDVEGEWELSADVTSTGTADGGLVIRSNSSGTGYFVWASNILAIYAITGGTSLTNLGASASNAGRRFYFRALGSSISVWSELGDALTVTTATTLTGPYVGFYAHEGIIVRGRIRRI